MESFDPAKLFFSRIIRITSADPNYWWKVVGLALLYIVAAKLGLSLAETTKQVTTIWPPTGIALVALFWFGSRYWPGIFIGAFIANVLTNEAGVIALMIAIGNTLEAIGGVYLLRRFIKFAGRLDRVASVLGLVILAGCISTAISATIGTTALLLGHLIGQGEYRYTWYTWWTGDAMGDLVLVPWLLVMFKTKGWCLLKKRQVEAIALLLLLIIVSAAIFVWPHSPLNSQAPLPYLLFPVIIWAALRFTQVGVVNATLLISTLAVIATLHRRGPFISGASVEQNIIALHLFIAVLATTSLLLAAVVSERLRTERALRSQAKALALAQARIAQDITRLKIIQKQKNQLVSMASHELNTPLTSTKLFADILERHLQKSTDKTALSYLSKLDSQLNQLARRVRDLVDVAKVRAGEFNLEISQWRLDLLLKGVVADIQLTAPDHRLVVENVDRAVVMADEDRIRQVMINLLTNAIRYSEPATPITVTSQIKNRFAVVMVTDLGSGISSTDRLKIFRPFYRAETLTKPGLGLGLYIARRIIDQHGGRLWVESRLGQGSTFFFSIPLSK